MIPVSTGKKFPNIISSDEGIQMPARWAECTHDDVYECACNTNAYGKRDECSKTRSLHIHRRKQSATLFTNKTAKTPHQCGVLCRSYQGLER